MTFETWGLFMPGSFSPQVDKNKRSSYSVSAMCFLAVAVGPALRLFFPVIKGARYTNANSQLF